MKRIFVQKSTSYNLRMNNLLDVPRPQTVSYGIQCAVFLGCSLWLRVPDEVKTSRTIDDFKNFIKHWKGQEKCPCKILSTHVTKMLNQWRRSNLPFRKRSMPSCSHRVVGRNHARIRLWVKSMILAQ